MNTIEEVFNMAIIDNVFLEKLFVNSTKALKDANFVLSVKDKETLDINIQGVSSGKDLMTFIHDWYEFGKGITPKAPWPPPPWNITSKPNKRKK